MKKILEWSRVSGRNRYFMSVTCLLILSAGLAAAQGRAGTQVLARAGNLEYGVEQIRSLLPELSPSEKEALAENTDSMRQIVRNALLLNLVLEEALKNHWDSNPVAMERVKRARQSALIESYLDAVAAVPEGFPGEEDLAAYYEMNQALLTVPHQLHLAQIFIAQPAGENGEQQAGTNARISEIQEAVKTGNPDFATLARLFSDETQSAGRGGDLGWLAEDQILPSLRKQLGGMEEGTVAGPLRTDSGWHFVKCLGVRDSRVLELDEVRPLLVERMRAERKASNRQAYLARLVKEHPVAINELVLRELIKDGS